MGTLRTLARVLTGFVLACLVAALVQVLFVSTPAELAAVPAGAFPAEASNTLSLVLKAATHFAIFAIAFALIAAGIAEWLSLRGIGYWLTVGAGIGLLGFIAQFSSEVAGQPTILNSYALQSFLTAGFFGGLTYWMVAGARSGARNPFEELANETAAATPRILVEKAPREIKKGSLAERLALKRAASGDAATPGKAAETPAASPGASPATAVPVTKPDKTAGQAKPPVDRADTPKPPGPAPAPASAAAAVSTAPKITPAVETAKADVKDAPGQPQVKKS